MKDEEKIRDIFDALKSEGLTDRERFVLRKELEFFMGEHPTRIPLRIEIIDRVFSFENTMSLYMRAHTQVVAASLVFVLFAGAGTSYASSTALPGDTLYPIKIHVNERVQAALATTPQAKVNFSTVQTERRLEEAETLAAEGTLTPEKGAAVAEGIKSATDDFTYHIAALAEMSESGEEVTDAQSNQEASLIAHARILSALSENTPGASDSITSILSEVRREADTTGRARAESQMVLRNKKGPDTKAFAETKKQIALDRLKQIRALADQEKGALGTSTFTRIHEEASSTEQTITSGDIMAGEGDYGQALDSYQEAIRASQTSQIDIRAQVNLRRHQNTQGDPVKSSSGDNGESHAVSEGGKD